MGQVHAFVVVILFWTRLVPGDHADPLYLSPYDIRNYPSAYFPPNVNYPSQQILHLNPKPRFASPERPPDQDFMFNEISEALNEVHKEDRGDQRAAARDPAPYTQYGYGSNYGQLYHSTTPAPTVITTVQPTKIPLLKPDLSALLHPATSKISNKANGLVSLIFSALTGSPLQGDFGGIKDIIIEGILRPLLSAKSGIKSLVSKLSIPLVSLLLINLEVLVTVWWLWEECPAPPPTPVPIMPTTSPKPHYPEIAYS